LCVSSFADPHALGLFCSLSTALCWAIAVILFKKSGDRMGPLPLNVFKNVFALALMLLTLFVLGVSEAPRNPYHLAALFVSGAAGIGIADTLLFYGLNQIGASRQAIIDALYSPIVVLLSFVLLGEVLGVRAALGGLLILSAVVLGAVPTSTRAPVENERVVRGTLASALAILLMALSIVAVKPVLAHYDVLFATSVRLAGGTFILAVYTVVSRERRRNVMRAFTPSRTWRYALPGAFMGTYLSVLLWIGSFKYAPANIAALLNQTSTIFIIVLATVFLREPLTKRVSWAVGLATTGALLVLS
jgi:drug/metabolite transporter (DMT)-like permease